MPKQQQFTAIRKKSLKHSLFVAVFIEVKVREQMLAKRTGLSVRAVETAIISLEVGGLVSNRCLF